jgi:predicted metalloprotease with PDZ domain
MRYLLLFFFLVFQAYSINAQTNSYTISFRNAEHHEAVITANFPNITTDTLSIRMSRTSPGRYALHEFAKNIYNLTASDGKGNIFENKVSFFPNPK